VRHDEDLAVADLAGTRRLDDRVDRVSTASSATTISIFTLGRKSTTYSAPRYSSVCPFWRPKPLTSVTVRPETPISDKRFAHFVEFERFDDGFDFLHCMAPES
jgi:hypothetical protein